MRYLKNLFVAGALALALMLTACNPQQAADWTNANLNPNPPVEANSEQARGLSRIYTEYWRQQAALQRFYAALEAQQNNLVWKWSGVAQCESGGNWSINTGNGFYGGLQFMLSSWRAVGGTGYPHNATPYEQAQRAERLKAIQGIGAWPHCGRYYR